MQVNNFKLCFYLAKCINVDYTTQGTYDMVIGHTMEKMLDRIQYYERVEDGYIFDVMTRYNELSIKTVRIIECILTSNHQIWIRDILSKSKMRKIKGVTIENDFTIIKINSDDTKINISIYMKSKK